MPAPTQIRSQVQSWLTSLWSHIQTKQEEYFAEHGRYFQGLRTHTITPADGNEIAPNSLSTTPPDHPAWGSVFTLPASFPCTLIIDAYTGPSGPGYVGIVRVTINGNTWERRQNHGSETWRTAVWSQVD